MTLTIDKGLATKKLDEYQLNVEDPTCSTSLALLVRRLTAGILTDGQELVLLCIGTDRCTGDALGPLIGSQLLECSLPGVHIYGTLEKPVHATNLEDTIGIIRKNHHRPMIIAVDACLGKVDSVGKIMIGKGTLKPGAGVNKDLPEVGDIYITGVVNVGGFMDYFVLQNTRLFVVNRLALTIAEGLSSGLSSLHIARLQTLTAYE